MSSDDTLAAKIRAKIEWHRSEIERLQTILDEFDAGSALPAPEHSTTSLSVPPGELSGLGFMAAVRRVMGPGEALSAKDIADRLRAAGYRSDAKDFQATVYNSLDQQAKRGAITKVGDRASGVLWRRS